MDKDNIDVSDDYLELQRLLDEHKITPKTLATWAGRSLVTIYKYLSGECTIPMIIWRSIFAHTFDIKVFNLVRGDIPIIVVSPTDEDLSFGTDSLRELLSMRQKQLKLEEYILQILEDGQIDSSDRTAVANFRLAFPDMINAQARMHQAIINEYKKYEAANT